eukprot:CAMPEP_0116891352 /NCGR_PEP_ID=MMETSP0467-20121206/1787_1 /TAXON_ID=283647 /ORGANISM="Mesodinium pulex, Strain SPMC105" /LENGTH=43 /DNA_ID= /DNA_START= /DNA_END= /DNA_ORIENTATION=
MSEMFNERYHNSDTQAFQTDKEIEIIGLDKVIETLNQDVKNGI